MVYPTNLVSISIVYNFRLAQITQQPIFEKTDDINHIIIALAFDQYRKKYTRSIHQNFLGALGSFIYDPRPYYFRTDFAVSHIKEKTKSKTTFSGAETDDILFTLGRNFKINEYASLTFAGLFGIPTHKVFRLQRIDVGYSQVGLGMQFDGLYQLHHRTGLVYGARYIYFVPRNALGKPNQKYTLTIGNVADLIIALKNNWNNHGFELGFTERFRFGAHITPSLPDFTKKTNYIRSTFYATYKYRFLIRTVQNRFLLNFSYGLDTNSKIFGNRYIITVWASWNVSF